MVRLRISHAVAGVAIFVILAVPAFGATVTRGKVLNPGRTEVRLKLKGTFDAEDWGEISQVRVAAADREETLPLSGFRYVERKDRYVWRGERTDLVRKAVFDRRRGTFRIQCRNLPSWAYADPLVLTMELAATLHLALPVSPERRRSRVRGPVFPYTEILAAELRSAVVPDLEEDGRLDGIVVVDTRSETAYEAGHVPGAIYRSYTDIVEDGATALPFPPDTRLVFYCYGGT